MRARIGQGTPEPGLAAALELDSHIPELLARLTPAEDPLLALVAFEKAADLCLKRGVPCAVRVRLATENASTLPETVAFLAGAGVSRVTVVPYRDPDGDRHLDARGSFSAAYLESIRSTCAAVADQQGLGFEWRFLS